MFKISEMTNECLVFTQRVGQLGAYAWSLQVLPDTINKIQPLSLKAKLKLFHVRQRKIRSMTAFH